MLNKKYKLITVMLCLILLVSMVFAQGLEVAAQEQKDKINKNIETAEEKLLDHIKNTLNTISDQESKKQSGRDIDLLRKAIFFAETYRLTEVTAKLKALLPEGSSLSVKRVEPNTENVEILITDKDVEKTFKAEVPGLKDSDSVEFLVDNAPQVKEQGGNTYLTIESNSLSYILTFEKIKYKAAKTHKIKFKVKRGYENAEVEWVVNVKVGADAASAQTIANLERKIEELKADTSKDPLKKLQELQELQAQYNKLTASAPATGATTS